MNTELLIEVRDFIKAHPRNVHMDHFELDTASCGTVACIAGWACILSGLPPSKLTAAELLDISDNDADKLFFTYNWPHELHTGLNMSSGQAYADVVVERVDYFIYTGI